MAEPRDPDGVTERRLEDGGSDSLIREEPLLIAIAGQQVLTMRTPGDDVALAVGFLLTEGVLADLTAVQAVELLPGDPAVPRADTVHVVVPAGRVRVEGRLTRTHEVRASCGICGMADADALLDELPPLLPGVPLLDRARLLALQSAFTNSQPCFARTGACHAAALFGAGGELWSSAEDVGRHNALDKAIGAAARAGRDLTRGIAMLSGRAGADLVLKCLRVRIPVILSVSAPSALAFDLCKAAGATLLGFVRGESAKVYWAAGRVR